MTTATLAAPYTSPEALGESRRQVEDLVCGLPGGDREHRGFEHPWEIRAFAMAVAAHRALGFDWSQFQAALIASIREWEAAGPVSDGTAWSYYEHWVTALESVMSLHRVLVESDLEHKTRQILAEPPNRNHHQAHTEPIAVDPARTIAP